MGSFKGRDLAQRAFLECPAKQPKLEEGASVTADASDGSLRQD